MTSTAYPVHTITRDQISEWEGHAKAADRFLDHWFPIDGDDETVAAHIVPAKEYELARSLRYLGLNPAQDLQRPLSG